MKLSANSGPRGDPMATPSFCRWYFPLNRNRTFQVQRDSRPLRSYVGMHTFIPDSA
ncbi:unnamed protein product, partial [Dicrocoelium dendriticum]